MKPSKAMEWLAVACPTWTPYSRVLASAYVVLRFAARVAGVGRVSLALHIVHAVWRTTGEGTLP